MVSTDVAETGVTGMLKFSGPSELILQLSATGTSLLIGLLHDILLLRFLCYIASVATVHSRHIKVLLAVKLQLRGKRDDDSSPCLCNCSEHKLTKKHRPFIIHCND